ncbi:hypothetical protein BGZ80_000172 [Entomortierella chlamydospora]|uniref:Uncharacterized protein n=1 Tax=Entomortierella chlamydospora TaxID=101097 RepID=A0A9P6N3S9_9FUNG|nr:hypothetical protein BGZ80_000172 [Entomortierella chlamydospora]
MPEQPPYERKKDGAEPGTKSAIKTGTSTVEPSVTVTTKKRRFSNSSESSRGSQDTQLASSTTKVTSNEKSSASNQHRSANSKKLSSEPSKPLSANQWEKTAFIGDSDGAKRVKFLRLSNRRYTAR